MGDITPVLAMDQRRLREASHRTTRELLEEPWPGSEADVEFPFFPGGKSLATHRSPCGEGVKR